jgi:hypothetical protein
MSSTMPRVTLVVFPRPASHWLEDPQQPGVRLRLDTPEWFAWLEKEEVRRFSYPVDDAEHGYIEGFMTVRKERRERGGEYWTAYRRTRGRLRKVYLGGSAAVTNGRLVAVAEQFLQGAREWR